MVSVHAYLLFSNLIKLSFRSRHLLIHESFTTREVSFEHHAEELGYTLTLLSNLEESGTGIRHEVYVRHHSACVYRQTTGKDRLV